jgi:hypothetical protein
MRRTIHTTVGTLFCIWALGSGCSSTSGGGGFNSGDGGPSVQGDAGTQSDGLPPGEDGSPAVDGSGGVDGSAFESVCMAAGTSLCMKLNTCFPFLVETSYGDLMRCRNRYAIQCVAQLAAPGSGVSSSYVQSCDAAIAAGSCTALLDGVLPSACAPVPMGQLAAGAACGESSQCAGGDCRKPTGSYCGTCTTLAAAGASCASADCAPGLACTSNMMCTPLAALGATCDATHPCEPTLSCNHLAKCAARLHLGAACNPVARACDELAGQVCDGVTKKCVQAQVSTTMCGVVNGTAMACKGGAVCQFPSRTSATGTCVAPAMDGGACSTTNGPSCFAPAYCSAGKCTLPDPTTCH